MPTDGPPAILVLDADRPAAVAVLRSLGRAGYRCTAAAPTATAIGFRSKYAAATTTYPDPTRDRTAFQRWIDAWLASNPARIVVPVTDLTLAPLVEIRTALEPRTRVAAATNDALEIAWSKGATTALATALDVPCPRSVVVQSPAEAATVAASMELPIVVKPDRSVRWDADGAASPSLVAICRRREDFAAIAERMPYPIVLQEYVAGEGIGIGVLCAGGRILEDFQWRRLHEVPLDGGGSSYRISERVDPELRAWSERLAARLRWEGVAMFEYKRNRATGRSALLEINGRFWGSLPLAVAAGADFPANFARLLLDGPSAVRVRPFRAGVRCRNLSLDFEWLRGALLRLRRDRPIPPGRIARDLLRLASPTERFDLQSLDDWGPGAEELRRLRRRVRQMLSHRRAVATVRQEALAVRADPARLGAALADADEIVTVCAGNRVRSVYAAERLRQWLPPGAPAVRSAGVEARAGDAPDPKARLVAERRGVHFGRHVATPCSALDPRPRAVFLAMEVRHVLLLREQLPQSAARTFLVGSGLDDGDVEIPDPIDLDEAVYDARFAEIDRALRKCVDLIPGREQRLGG